jgi:hypothetical protein
LPKTVSARIENSVHDDLVEKCNRLGCRISDYVKASIEIMLYGETEFDFGQEEEEKQEMQKPATEPRIHYIEQGSHDPGATHKIVRI